MVFAPLLYRGRMPGDAGKYASKTKPPQAMTCGVVARLSGFEPKAYRLGGGRSILLSYRRIQMDYSKSAAVL